MRFTLGVKPRLPRSLAVNVAVKKSGAINKASAMPAWQCVLISRGKVMTESKTLLVKYLDAKRKERRAWEIVQETAMDLEKCNRSRRSVVVAEVLKAFSAWKEASWEDEEAEANYEREESQ